LSEKPRDAVRLLPGGEGVAVRTLRDVRVLGALLPSDFASDTIKFSGHDFVAFDLSCFLILHFLAWRESPLVPGVPSVPRVPVSAVPRDTGMGVGQRDTLTPHRLAAVEP
jgi:hypothetical protein